MLDQASEIQQQPLSELPFSPVLQPRFELQPQKLAFLHNILIAAYRHKWRLRGQSADHRVKELQKLLEARKRMIKSG